jgi:hypothetical protein
MTDTYFDIDESAIPDLYPPILGYHVFTDAQWQTMSIPERLEAIRDNKAHWTQIEDGIGSQSKELNELCNQRVKKLAEFIYEVAEDTSKRQAFFIDNINKDFSKTRARFIFYLEQTEAAFLGSSAESSKGIVHREIKHLGETIPDLQLEIYNLALEIAPT